MREKINYLSHVDLFNGLSSRELEEVEKMTAVKKYPKRTILYRPNESGEVLFLLKQGKVRIFNISPEGKELTLDVLGTGTIFGEMSLMGQGMYGAFAEVMEDCVVCVMNKRDVQQLLLAKPQVALRAIEIVTGRLKEMEEKFEDMAFKDVAGRLAALLLRLAKSDSRKPVKRIQISPRPTHQELAEMIGTSRETLTRVLNKLQGESIVSIRREGIELINPLALEEIGRK